MAVKPSITYTLATNVNFTVGPFIGSACKVIPGDIPNGNVPGNGIVAEWANYMWNISGQWITDWLDLGSSIGTLDAHIVETDALGLTSIAGADLGNTALASFGLAVTSNAGAPSFAATISNIHGGFGLNVSNTHANATVRAVQNGTGVCFEAISVGTGDAAVFTAGTGINRGITVTGGTTGGDAIEAQANGGGAGIFAIGGATGPGMIADRLPAGGPAGVFRQNGGGAPARGIVYLEPTGEPTAPAAGGGDVFVSQGSAGFGRGGLSHYDSDGSSGGGAGGFQKHWTTTGGIGFGYASVEATSVENAGVITTKVALNLDATGSPGNGQGEYLVTYSCSVYLGAGAALGTRVVVEFHDTTGMVNQFEIDFVALAQPKPVMAMIKTTLGGGINPLSIKFKTATPGQNVVCENARISAQGAYE